jgi:hypothetical protein
MTTSSKGFKIGFRNLQFFALNSYQTPLAASPTVPYEGLTYTAARALALTIPQPRAIDQQGDDRVEALDFLPPSTSMTAELHVGLADLDIIALLTGTKKDTIGTSNWVPLSTNQQGLEPFVGILAYSQSLNYPLGNRTWDWYFFPYARAIYAASSLAETPQDVIFRVAPQYTSLTPWGAALVAATNGALTMQGLQGISEGRPHLACFLADGTATTFSFDTSHPAYSTSSIKVFVNEAADATAGKTVAGVTPTSKPNLGDRVEVWYEE